jgi:DNA topoisomerase IA
MLYKTKIIGYTESGLQSVEGGIYADTLRKTFGRQGFYGGRRGYYQNETVIITYCVGHLFELAKPESYHPSCRLWDAAKLPIIPDKFRYKPIPDVVPKPVSSSP